MASLVTRIVADNGHDISNTNGSHISENPDGDELNVRATIDTATPENANRSEDEVSSSSYILANDLSQLSRDVDRWITGSATTTPTESTGVQSNRQTVMQRSTVTSSCMATNTMWYVIAMMLPMLSLHNCVMTLRCTPSNILNTAEIFFHNVSRICAKAKLQIQRIARDQIARDLFATAMDILLIVYALGFLVLSMYQASIIG